ncbi:putative glycosyltransferase EpsH [Novipirellula aureliae]|uniref:Putative glycosyltransferase EpsH n=1 Tax=Novipirellula aureliae TaxID=2527966 RepID=A0A5C6E9C7_9BACT|nr:glycosyltransferase family 2 protein [Novipirellula aureliae]TWU44331.1 putative glycosyltransferase EpsH [Novipirellula aureliae]
MKIATIIPCYNAAAYLGEALESVFRQTLQPDQVIVADDGSTDGSPTIAQDFGVQLVRTSRNQGHAAARNLAMQAAQADMIAWLDADVSCTFLTWIRIHTLALIDEIVPEYPEFSDVTFRFSKALSMGWHASPPDWKLSVPVSQLWKERFVDATWFLRPTVSFVRFKIARVARKLRSMLGSSTSYQ